MRKFFSIEIEGKAIDPKGRNYTSLASLLAARQSLSKLRNVDIAYKQAYSATTSILETTIARTMGATKIKETSGKGAIFDFILYDENQELTAAEAKLINVETLGNKITSASSISVSSSSIALRSGSSKQLITGINANIDLSTTLPGQELTAKEAVTTEKVTLKKSFINRLLEAKGDQLAIKRILNGKDKAAVALRKNFELKSSDIRILYTVNGSTKVASIGWTWRDIMRNNKAVITIEGMDDSTGLYINVVFNESLIRDALNKANSKTVELLSSSTANSVLTAVAEDFGYLSKHIREIIERTIDSEITYDAGSVLVYKSNVKAKTVKTKDVAKSRGRQAFISNIQWTMLTQKRLGETMKRVGAPEPPNIKERSGRFRASVEVTTNYRSNIINYTYNPLYRGLEHYGYHPELQVERAIKEVAQQLYNRHFIITRAGSLA